MRLPGFGRQRGRQTTDGNVGVPGSAVHVYEIDGRVLVRTVDGSDRLGIERTQSHVLDGFPDIDPGELGPAVVLAHRRAREVARPASWPPLSAYAATLIAESPKRYRSHRTWQRAARFVTVHLDPEGWRIERQHPDLNRGSWEPLPPGPIDPAHPHSVLLPVGADPTALGQAVLDVLGRPPLGGSD